MFPNWTHWKTVKMILFILTTSAGAVAASNGDPSVKQSAAFATTMLGILGTLVVILSGTPVGPPMAKHASKALAVVALFVFGGAISACSGAQQSAAIADGGQLFACVVPVVALDVAAGKPWTQCIADAVAKCGADAASVGTIWAAHVHAETIEGKTGAQLPIPLGMTLDAGGAP